IVPSWDFAFSEYGAGTAKTVSPVPTSIVSAPLSARARLALLRVARASRIGERRAKRSSSRNLLRGFKRCILQSSSVARHRELHSGVSPKAAQRCRGRRKFEWSPGRRVKPPATIPTPCYGSTFKPADRLIDGQERTLLRNPAAGANHG